LAPYRWGKSTGLENVMVVEIALGILLAVLLLAVGIAALAVVIKFLGEIFAFVMSVGSLFLLNHFLGGWGLALWFALIFGFIGIAARQEARREKAKAEEEARKAKDHEAKRLAEREKWAREEKEQEARIEKWRVEEQAREEREKKEREARRAAYAAKKEAEREMCIKALREGHAVIGIDGRKKSLKDFGIYE
jgi:hypothetical protein